MASDEEAPKGKSREFTNLDKRQGLDPNSVLHRLEGMRQDNAPGLCVVVDLAEDWETGRDGVVGDLHYNLPSKSQEEVESALGYIYALLSEVTLKAAGYYDDHRMVMRVAERAAEISREREKMQEKRSEGGASESSASGQ